MLRDLGLGSFLNDIKPQDMQTFASIVKPQDMQAFASIIHTDTDTDTDTDKEAEQGGQKKRQLVASTEPQGASKSLKQQNPDALSSSSAATALEKFLAEKREIEAKEEEESSSDARQLASTPEISKPDLIKPDSIKSAAAAAATATATHAYGQEIKTDINNIMASPAHAVPFYYLPYDNEIHLHHYHALL